MTTNQQSAYDLLIGTDIIDRSYSLINQYSDLSGQTKEQWIESVIVLGFEPEETEDIESAKYIQKAAILISDTVKGLVYSNIFS